jgi:hypothetical protein
MVSFTIACLLSFVQHDYKVLQSHVSFMTKILFFMTKVVVVNLKFSSSEMNKYLTLVNMPLMRYWTNDQHILQVAKQFIQK